MAIKLAYPNSANLLKCAIPAGIAVSNDNNWLIVAEKYGHRLRKIRIDAQNPAVWTIAGPTCDNSCCAPSCLDGECCQKGQQPECVATRIGDTVKGSGDGFDQNVDGNLDDCSDSDVSFNQPVSVAVYPNNNNNNYAIVVDRGNNMIREIDLGSGLTVVIRVF